MDEDISIIDTKTRNEKIKSFFIENKKLLISVSLFLLLIILSFYSYQIYKDKQKSSLSNEYNNAIIEYKKGDKSKSISSMVKIVEDKDTTYSPLALYFIIDNNLIDKLLSMGFSYERSIGCLSYLERKTINNALDFFENIEPKLL